MLFQIKMPKNISKYLGKKYGGIWTWDRHGGWWCDDGLRHVCRVQSCSCDDICNHYPDWRLYGDGVNGIIYFD